MAKMLSTNPPTSSIARLLDSAAAGAAVGPIASPAAPRVPPVPPLEHAAAPVAPEPATSQAPARSSSRDLPTIKRELVLSPLAEATFTELVDALRRATGTKLTASHAFRSLMRALAPAVTAIAERPDGVRLRLPSNAPGYETEREDFEAALCRLMQSAIYPGNRNDA